MKGEITKESINRSASKFKSATAAANTAVTNVITADARECHVILGIEAAFSATAANISLTVVAGSTTIWQGKVSNPGEQFEFPEGLHNLGALNETVTITLAAGGVGVVGCLNSRYV